LEGGNGKKSSNDAVSSTVLLATMKAQQAVAIRFVGRRVTTWTCLFFSFISASLSAWTPRLPRPHRDAMHELSQQRFSRCH
jgi:hypothetical protein